MFAKGDKVAAVRRSNNVFIVVRRVDDTTFYEVTPAQGGLPNRFFVESDIRLVEKTGGSASAPAAA